MIAFVVPGKPVPKGRPRYKAGRVYTPVSTTRYEQKVAWFARKAKAQRTDKPVSISLIYYMPDRHRVDLDNLIKSVADGLNGIAWDDDSQICEIHAVRKIDADNPGVHIIIEEI